MRKGIHLQFKSTDSPIYRRICVPWRNFFFHCCYSFSSSSSTTIPILPSFLRSLAYSRVSPPIYVYSSHGLRSYEITIPLQIYMCIQIRRTKGVTKLNASLLDSSDMRRIPFHVFSRFFRFSSLSFLSFLFYRNREWKKQLLYRYFRVGVKILLIYPDENRQDKYV